MTAKEFLQQVEKLDTLLQNKLVEREMWRSVALSVTSRSDGLRVQTTKEPHKMEGAVVNKLDIEREIDETILRIAKKRSEILKVIEQLPSSVEYDVLHKRYIQRLSFPEIAEEYGKGYSWATTVHGRALESLREILKEQENEKNKV